MIALTIEDLKVFMHKLLLSPTFDDFLIQEASLTTCARFHIDGLLQKDFFDSQPDEEEQRDYLYWKEIKEYIYSLIKGKRKPLNFKFTFCLSPRQMSEFFQKEEFSCHPSFVRSLIFNLYFDGQKLTCTTASSYRQFILDKSIDLAWDSYIKEYFLKMQISALPLS